MALRHIPRHRMPVDGTWVRTEARLDGIIRCEAGDDDSLPPESIRDSWVPIWVRMELYKAQETPKHPDGMIYGPVVKIGSLQSPEITLFGHHYSAGLSRDGELDGWEATDPWLYHPLAGFYRDEPPPGEDVSQYECDRCQQWLYRDDTGRRHAKSACISDGGLVCRDCEVTGMVYAADVEQRLASAGPWRTSSVKSAGLSSSGSSNIWAMRPASAIPPRPASTSTRTGRLPGSATPSRPPARSKQ